MKRIGALPLLLPKQGARVGLEQFATVGGKKKSYSTVTDFARFLG